MFSNFTIYLQRIGVVFGLSLALVSAVAAQTTADLEQPPTYDPALAGYGFRIGLNNFFTGVVDVFNDEAAAQRRIHLSDDYVRQCNKYKDNADILARVVARKEQVDQKLEDQAAALPTLKDEIARQFAEQRGLMLGLKAGAGGVAAQHLGAVLNNAAEIEAGLTNKKGLPADVKAQLEKYLTPEQIADIESAANTNWAEGFKRFNALVAQNPQFSFLEQDFHAGDLEANAGKYFLGAPPKEFLDQINSARELGKFSALQNPDFAAKYPDLVGKISGEIKFDFNERRGEFAKFLPPEQLQRMQQFHDQIKQEFGDPSKIDPSRFADFTKQFDSKFGPPPEGFRGGFGGPPPGGEFKAGPYPEPKSGQFGQPGSYQGQPSQPAPGQTYGPSPEQQTQYQSSGTYAPSPTETSSPAPAYTSTSPTSPTYTHSSPTPTYTSTSCPSGYTGTYPNCVKQ